MSDFTQGGQGDLISILLMNGSTYCTQAIGTDNKQSQLLDGGNVSVRNGSASSSPLELEEIVINENETGEPVPITKQDDSSIVKLRVYPNPFIDHAKVVFSVPSDTKAIVEIYSLMGVKVKTLFNDLAKAGQVYNLDFTNEGFANMGMYFCVLRTEYESKQVKVILTK